VKLRIGILFLLSTLFIPSFAQLRKEANVPHSLLVNLISNIPSRPASAMTGTEFARLAYTMKGAERERAIVAQLLRGNLPDFLRKMKPVRIVHRNEDKKAIVATIFVMPDYLAIGSDQDFLPIPMDFYSAVEIASQYGCILPTKKIVDAVFEQSAYQFAPWPMAPGPDMRSTAYYLRHALTIRRQRQELGCPSDAIVSGHKKDVVLTNRLARNHGKIAIYGWQRSPGDPIQSLSTVHGATYADYSHGIRLVSNIVLIDGKIRSIYQVLEDPTLAEILSDEGTMPQIREFMSLRREGATRAEPPSDFQPSMSLR
jgi:hypothetical protein